MNELGELRKKVAEKSVDLLEDAEGHQFQPHQREVIVAGILKAFQDGISAETAVALPTHEALKEQKLLYEDREVSLETGRKPTVIEFLEHGWPAKFIAAGLLTRPDFRRIDPKAEQALKNWVRETKQLPPDHLHIPTKSESIDRILAENPEKLREARRLARAHERRSGGRMSR